MGGSQVRFTGFRVQGLGLQDVTGFRVTGFRVQGFGLRVLRRVLGLGF